MKTVDYDYVIVGAGAAGCAIANKLSEDPDVTVCLIESGVKNSNPFIHIPAGFSKVVGNPNYTTQYGSEPTSRTANRPVEIVQGRVLGGSTSVNGMVYIRGQRGDYDGWAADGNSGWGYVDVLPYFKALETRNPPGDPNYRGTSGPVDVTDIRWRDPACDAFIEAAQELGLPLNPDYNAQAQLGVAYIQTMISNHRRVSAATAFLRPARNRENLTVLTEATAEQIEFQDKVAVGIIYSRGGSSFTAMARREVILSAGAVNTPRLLQVSGVGDPALLKNLGVPIVAPLQGVGKNLQDHYLCSLTASGKNFLSINQMAVGSRLFGQVARYLLGKTSVLELAPCLIHWFAKSALAKASDDADIQGVFTPASTDFAGALDKEAGMTIGFWQHRPLSRGHVSAVSTNAADYPIIQPNYLQHEVDREIVLEGFRKARALLNSAALSPFVKAETSPGAGLQTDDELLDYAGRTGRSAPHLCGTAKMGPKDDPFSVVDAELRVHGVDGLRVVDASIMPRVTSANTMATTIMIGMKGADMIRSRRNAPRPKLETQSPSH
jgi:choline dehydrogenase